MENQVKEQKQELTTFQKLRKAKDLFQAGVFLVGVGIVFFLLFTVGNFRIGEDAVMLFQLASLLVGVLGSLMLSLGKTRHKKTLEQLDDRY